MWSRVYETVRCPSVCPSVCPSKGPQQQIRCGRFAAVGPAIDCCTAGVWRANAGSATLSAYVTSDLAQFGLGGPQLLAHLGELGSGRADLGLQAGLSVRRRLGVARSPLGRLLAGAPDPVVREVLDIADVLLQLHYLVLRRLHLHTAAVVEHSSSRFESIRFVKKNRPFDSLVVIQFLH